MAKNIFIAVNILLFSAAGFYGQSPRPQPANTPSLPAPSSYDLQHSYVDIKSKAKTTADALVRRDFNTVADHTYPKVIKLLGGRANMIATTKQEMRKIESSGFTVKSVRVGEPNKIEIIGRQLFSIVPTTLTMTVPGGMMLAESFLIAVSEDGARTWTFVDGSVAGRKSLLRQVFPFAADKLRLPQKKQPIIYPSQRG